MVRSWLLRVKVAGLQQEAAEVPKIRSLLDAAEKRLPAPQDIQQSTPVDHWGELKTLSAMNSRIRVKNQQINEKIQLSQINDTKTPAVLHYELNIA